jgi:hypothetical protein
MTEDTDETNIICLGQETEETNVTEPMKWVLSFSPFEDVSYCSIVHIEEPASR